MAEQQRDTGSGGWSGLDLVLLVLAAALPLLVYRHLLGTDLVFYEFDSVQLQYPRYVILREALLDGRFPALWQSLLYGGGPFHANPENPTLYPPALLAARLLEPAAAINAVAVGHLAFGAAGLFLLLRRLAGLVGLDPDAARAGAFVGALCFALNGFMRLQHLHLVTYGAAQGWAAWVLLAATELLYGARPRRAAGALGLALGLQVWTGGLYAVAYSALGLVLWFVLLGLCGGPERRRRTLVHGGLAALVALSLAAAKALPYFEWVALTNRAEPEPLEVARGLTLAGPGEPSWANVVLSVRNFTGWFAVLLFALPSVLLLRRRAVAVLWLWVLVGFAAALGGPVWEFLHTWVPPFDSIRVARRAWTLVNLALPVLAGLGVAAVLARLRVGVARPLVLAALGLVLGVLSLPGLLHTWRHQAILDDPPSLGFVESWYPNWGQAARRAGADTRVYWVGDDRIDGHNEQFISAHLGVETPAGYLGHVWPRALERHLWAAPDRPLPPAVLARRLGVLSTGLLVTGETPRAEVLIPRQVDGARVEPNPFARPRVWEPRAVVAVVGDRAGEALYALLDDPAWPLTEATLLGLDDAPALPDEAWAAVDLLWVVGDPARAVAALAAAEAAGVEVVRGGAPLDPPARGGAPLDPDVRAALLTGVRAALDAAPATDPRPRLERGDPEAMVVERPAPTAGAFLVASERWWLFPGWSARPAGAAGAADPRLPILRADGLASAVWCPAGVERVTLRYRPRSVTSGLALALVGLVAGAALLLAPERRRPPA